MVDSDSVAVGGEVPSGVTDLLVVDEAGGEGQEAQRDSHAEAFESAPAVVFEGELALAGPDDRLDPLADAAERAVAGRGVLAVRSEQPRAEGGHVLLELFACEPL